MQGFPAFIRVLCFNSALEVDVLPTVQPHTGGGAGREDAF